MRLAAIVISDAELAEAPDIFADLYEYSNAI